MATKPNGPEVFRCCICEREQLADIGEEAALAVGWTKREIERFDSKTGDRFPRTGYFWLCPFCSDDE